jgi:hypothetical protein
VEVLASALRHGVDPEDIQHALAHALAVDEVGDDPLRYLVLGPDRAGNLLELAVLDRPNGPAVIHAISIRPNTDVYCLEGGDHDMTTKGNANADSLSDTRLEALADEAERGYDVNAILQRRRGGSPAFGFGGRERGVGAARPGPETGVAAARRTRSHVGIGGDPPRHRTVPARQLTGRCLRSTPKMPHSGGLSVRRGGGGRLGLGGWVCEQ